MTQSRRTTRRRTLSAPLGEKITARRAIADQVISLANLIDRPVVNNIGTRVGKVSDILVEWHAGVTYPPVMGVITRAGNGFALIEQHELTLTQTGARLRSDRQIVSRPVRDGAHVALARDVLDRQIVDVTGVQVVRAADVYLLNGPRGWELAGVDVGLWSLARRLLTRRKACPPPDRAIDWADLQAFVPRFTATTLRGPAAAAGTLGGGLQLAGPAAGLNKLRASDVAAILAELGSRRRAHVSALAAPLAAAGALHHLTPAQRDAMLAQLGESDRARLQALLRGGEAP